MHKEARYNDSTVVYVQKLSILHIYWKLQIQRMKEKTDE